MKWFKNFLETVSSIIDSLKVEGGDILISRSGSIGKVTCATKEFAENYVISDDLVRVRVKDKDLRVCLLAYLSSSTAQSLMLIDEYGSVQQHLQPRHIQQMLIPVPNEWKFAKEIIDSGIKLIEAMEKISLSDQSLRKNKFELDYQSDISRPLRKQGGNH